MVSELELTIDKIYGTSSENSSQFAAQGDLIAYTASAGVVVCKLSSDIIKDTDNSPNEPHHRPMIKWQKFFCANSMFAGNNNSNLNNVTNLPLNLGCYDYTASTTKTDEFDYPINSDPEIVTRQGTVQQDDDIGTTNPTLTADGVSPTRPLRLRKDDYSSLTSSPSPVLPSGPASLANRVRSINCIAISPDKKLLAVGEVGYQPRILLYSLASDSSCKPIYIIQEHQFGVNSLSFSGDSKRLCSLGLINDGFLIIWKFQNKKINFVGSNKCSCIVNKLIWHDDQIITIGLRHVKIWKEDLTRPSNTILKGRNALLKSFLNSNFIDIQCLNFEELLLLSDQGDLAVLNINEVSVVLRKLFQLPNTTNQFLINHNSGSLVLATDNSLTTFPIDSLLLNNLSPNDKIKPTPSSPNKLVKRSGIMALESLYNFTELIYLQDEQIKIVDPDLTVSPKTLINSLMNQLNGVKRCFNGDILAWSKVGAIKKLTEEGVESFLTVSLMPNIDLIENGLSALDYDKDGNLVVGDRYGNLYFYEDRNSDQIIKGFKEIKRIRAHESSINDTIFFSIGDFKFIASCSRDRTIQIFMKRPLEENAGEWNLFQTLSVHKGNVSKVMFKDNILIASSADRTLSIHRFEPGAENDDPLIYQEKIISNKSSTLTFDIISDTNELIVSTNDKKILIFGMKNYEQVRSLKLLNNHYDTLQIDQLKVHDGHIYTASSDKCIRLFNYQDGKLICSNWAHSESIISLVLLDDGGLVSASHDGCMFNWIVQDLSKIDSAEKIKSDSRKRLIEAPPSATLQAPTKVVRKILQAPILSPDKTTPPSIRRRRSTLGLTRNVSPTAVRTSSSSSKSKPSTPNSSNFKITGLGRAPTFSRSPPSKTARSKSPSLPSAPKSSSTLHSRPIPGLSPSPTLRSKLTALKISENENEDSPTSADRSNGNNTSALHRLRHHTNLTPSTLLKPKTSTSQLRNKQVDINTSISNVTQDLKLLQHKLIDMSTTDFKNTTEQETSLNELTFELKKTLRLLPNYDQDLLNELSNLLAGKTKPLHVRSARNGGVRWGGELDKENIENPSPASAGGDSFGNDDF